jgi:hypothetical protein
MKEDEEDGTRIGAVGEVGPTDGMEDEEDDERTRGVGILFIVDNVSAGPSAGTSTADDDEDDDEDDDDNCGCNDAGIARASVPGAACNPVTLLPIAGLEEEEEEEAEEEEGAPAGCVFCCSRNVGKSIAVSIQLSVSMPPIVS